MPIIEVSNLKKIFTSKGGAETVALAGVTFSIKTGEFVSVVGPSGSGKSTLLHILGFLDRQSSGRYLFDGKAIDDYTEEQLAHTRNKKMGFIFQSFNLLARTSVLDNVKLPLSYSGIDESHWDEMALRAIEAVGLSHRADHKPNQLSGGEKQRVAIARALVNDPNVIFADEPTGNLDSKSGGQIMDIIASLHQKGHTVILITHETYTAQYADRMITLRDGTVESDTKVEKKVEPNHFKK